MGESGEGEDDPAPGWRKRNRTKVGRVMRVEETGDFTGCVSRSGLRRERHEYDRDGVCLWCDGRLRGVLNKKHVAVGLRVVVPVAARRSWR
jgi:hypothetical protein